MFRSISSSDLVMFLGIFEEDFIEERRSGLEGFVNKVATGQALQLLINLI